jgi:hypothetical protein
METMTAEHEKNIEDLKQAGCCCGDYAAVMGTLHPDCPMHSEDNFVRHFVKDFNTTVRWRKGETSNTVLEYDTWEGQPSDTESVDRYRRVVLMEANHEVILKINRLIIEGDRKALLALLRTRELNDSEEQAILGYDFQRNEPRILLYLR